MRPATLEEAARLVREAGGVMIGPEPGVGAGPGVGSGGGATGDGATGAALLDPSGLTGPVEIMPDNLSGTFLAGTTLAEIDAALAPHGLWWPVDAAPHRTLGAVLATAGPYPGRTGYGPVRDWVLGIEAVMAGGERHRLGGSTMKNVAGYDLTRLLVGSRGTLGLIGAATLRLLPRPERQVTLALERGRYPQAHDLAAACEWDGTRLLVRLDGRASQVERRLAVLEGAEPAPVPDPWSDWHARAGGGRYRTLAQPDWRSVGAPLLGLWRTDEPLRYTPLELRLREAIAPGRCFNPHL